ncbi:MAG TPA: hypothetical protein VGB05_10355, partial [Pyrinomonadaceae bacterium]
MKFPLRVIYAGASLVVAVSLLLLVPIRAQRSTAPKPTPTGTTATTQTPAGEKVPAVTFDTLLSADAYGIYSEIRMVGRHAASQEIAQLIAPLALQSSGMEEVMFLGLYEFIKSHSEALMTSRLMFATMPVRTGVPEMLFAVEMPSAEAARKFVPELRQFITAKIPPGVITPTATTTTTSATENSNTTRRRSRQRARATAANAADEARAKQPAMPQLQLKRAGSIIAMSGSAFTFKDLRGGADQALLVNEPGFQAARTRFSADMLFVYFNTPRMTKSSIQRAEAWEKEYRRQQELEKAEARKRGAQANTDQIVEDETVVLSGDNMNITPTDANGNFSVTMNGNTSNANIASPPEDKTTPEPTPTPKSEKELEEERQRMQSQQFAQTMAAFVFNGRGPSEESWPESIGVGVSLDGDALVLRGLFVSASAEQPLRPIPFFPALLSGPAIDAEASRVLPADTDIFVSASLDLPQMYDYVASLIKIVDLMGAQEAGQPGFQEQLAGFEKLNNFRIREDLLASLGNEIAIGMPGNLILGGRRATQARTDDSSPPPPSGPIVVIALNDKESLQKLLPRVLNSIGFAGASEQSVVEKHGQVE